MYPPKIEVKMATGQSGETLGEMFHDIEMKCDDAVKGKLALQIHITQPGNHPLPVGVDHREITHCLSKTELLIILQ